MNSALSLQQGQGWPQVGDFALAFVLSAMVGLEREVRAKSAGLRTHTLVGIGAALFMLISKYGFGDVLGEPSVSFDPSRVAAQIVSGIGFIGGGLIFVRRDSVQGLTTAATVWLTAAIGAAAGAGLPVLAVLATAGHFAAIYGLGTLGRRLRRRSRLSQSQLRLTYLNGTGALRSALVEATRQGFSVAEVSVDRGRESDVDDGTNGAPVSVVLEVMGTTPVATLVASLAEVPGVVSLTAGNAEDELE
jgi:putative Mg2+ transporter-C (MgtC) family protein